MLVDVTVATWVIKAVVEAAADCVSINVVVEVLTRVVSAVVTVFAVCVIVVVALPVIVKVLNSVAVAANDRICVNVVETWRK